MARSRDATNPWRILGLQVMCGRLEKNSQEDQTCRTEVRAFVVFSTVKVLLQIINQLLIIEDQGEQATVGSI